MVSNSKKKKKKQKKLATQVFSLFKQEEIDIQRTQDISPKSQFENVANELIHKTEKDL